MTPQERVAARLAALAAANPPPPPRKMRPVWTGLALFAVAMVVCTAAYLIAKVPGTWFPSASAITWRPSDFGLARGTGAVSGAALVITGVDPAETAVVSINTDIRSIDYRSIVVDAENVPADAEVRLLWRTDYSPQSMFSVPVTVSAGRLLPVDVSAQSNWLGHVRGIALAIRTTLAQPMLIRDISAKPMGVADVLRERWREWFAFQSWTGTSINVVAGGAGVQDVPLPVFLLVTAVPALLLALLLLRKSAQRWAYPLAIGAVFVAAWWIGDARWQWNLVRQAEETRARYAGKDWREKHLAAEDGALFAFVETARSKLPPEPTRVFVVAEAHYFRDRAAYHLYPHNVFFNPYADTVPSTAALRPGDYILVYHRRGIQYDAALKRLRFPDGSTVAAEAVLVDRGAALMRVL
jgi:hypothetical protein